MTDDTDDTDPGRTDQTDERRSDSAGEQRPDQVEEHSDRDETRRSDREDRPPEEMDLDELREEIQEIDRELVELIARRTYVADTIAAVKDERGLPTTDERQEQRVMDRAGENAERFDVDDNLVKAIFRLLIELNKIEQRERR